LDSGRIAMNADHGGWAIAATSANAVCHSRAASCAGSDRMHQTKRRYAVRASRLRSCGHLPLPCAVAARQQRTFLGTNEPRAASFADVRFVPCVDGSELARKIFTSHRWSVQPCVRPVCAVQMTAGHNALRGSGPGQKPAFDDAMAHVGCPDRRIDRLCITCCSPSQPSHHVG
jgi:hypothetical protein